MNKPRHQPPRWADRFLEWFCHPDLLEEIQGDVYELFEMRARDNGATQARRSFIWDVFRSFRLSTVKNFTLLISPDMFKMNAKIALRQMRKQKVFSAIKIGGFALGVAACLLISLYINDESSYDQHYEKGDLLYRVVANNLGDDPWEKAVFLPAPLAESLAKDYPEVELAARINPGGLFGGGTNPLRRADANEVFFEDGFLLTDPRMLEILEIPIQKGKQSEALAAPKSMVISSKKAAQYYPNEDPIGQSIIVNNDPDQTYTISGVMEDFPLHSHLREIDFLVSLVGMEFWEGEQSYWRANNYHTYVRLKPDADRMAFEDKMKTLNKKYYLPAAIAAGIENPEAEAAKLAFALQPVSEIYLQSAGITDLMPHGDIRFVRLLGAVVFFILLLAIINFVNLSTAKSANRAREVGMRKVVGSKRSELLQQFLTESVLISAFSLAIGVVLAYLLLPYFNNLAEKELMIPWLSWWFFPLLLAAAIGLGLLAGIYPALFLSTFKPIDVLRGHLSRGAKSSNFRNALVVFQFTTSIILLIGTFVIYQQMDFILNKKLGFDKEQVILLKGTNTLGERTETFKKELLRLPGVKSASVSEYLPVDGTQRNSNRFSTEEEGHLLGQFWLVDYDYVPTLGMKILEGRNFSPEIASDSTAVIINEAMARQLGYDDPLGKRITNYAPQTIIGVVEDFHWRSLKDDIHPLCLAIGNSNSIISIKIQPEQLSQLTGQLTVLWDEFSPNQSINYSFLDEQYAAMYADVHRTRNVFISFALLAVFIACLGLFALSTFLAEQRYREISTRKVLGASMGHIIRQLSQHYLLLVLAALVIAIPVGWYLMSSWLEGFAYRITLDWPVFALAGCTAVMVALLTISYQTIRAARIDPVVHLRA